METIYTEDISIQLIKWGLSISDATDVAKLIQKKSTKYIINYSHLFEPNRLTKLK